MVTRHTMLWATLALLTPLAAAAGGRSVPRKFYQAKKAQTERDSYRRALDNLRAVSIGMSEMEFLDRMKMEVLARGGKPFDARMDGYLAEASLQANREARSGDRWLVFGYVEDDRVFERVSVMLRDRRVREIRAHAEVARHALALPQGGAPVDQPAR